MTGFVVALVLAAQTPQLRLQQLWSLELPDSFVLAGATLGPTGEAALWAYNQPYVLLVGPPRSSGGAIRVLSADALRRPVCAGFAGPDDQIVTIDGPTGAIAQFSPDGALAGIAGPIINGRVERCAIGRRARLLGVRDVPDTSAVRYWVETHPASGTPAVVRLDDQGRGFDRAWVGVSDEWVLLAAMAAPYTALVLDLQRQQVVQRLVVPDSLLTGALATAGVSDTSPRRDWAGMPLVPLDAGFLRTLADLTSDRRLLLLYDGSEHLVRVRSLDVPIGLHASLPSARLLLAVRRTNHAEVVVYERTWLQR